MLKCPECEKELKVQIPGESATDCQDIEFVCPDGHLSFVRIEADDLIYEGKL